MHIHSPLLAVPFVPQHDACSVLSCDPHMLWRSRTQTQICVSFYYYRTSLKREEKNTAVQIFPKVLTFFFDDYGLSTISLELNLVNPIRD
jgi:hypothetical protein